MIPYLCGGTFLTQILRVTERTTTSTDHTNGQKESLPEREVFRRLLSIYRLGEFPADAGGSIKTYASQFKVCQNALASFTGFAGNDSRMKFDRDVRSERSKALYMMSNFVSECIGIPKNGEQLVRCLLGMIKDDGTIKSTDEFYILPDGSPISKKDIDSTDKIYIEPFLLGVWHYVIMNRAEKNELGAETYQSWYPKRNDYRGTVGSGITMAIQIDSAKVEDPIKVKENVLRETFRKSSSDGFHNTTSFKKMFSSLFTNIPQKKILNKKKCSSETNLRRAIIFSVLY